MTTVPDQGAPTQAGWRPVKEAQRRAGTVAMALRVMAEIALYAVAHFAKGYGHWLQHAPGKVQFWP